ncbi:MAG: hypothetical protein ACR2M0_07690 [Chloroflexia bacterium]
MPSYSTSRRAFRRRASLFIRAASLIALLVSCYAIAVPTNAMPFNPSGSIYFSQTGHSLNNGFLSYWLDHGQAARWGYPLTEERQEGGLTVQYLERGLLEYNPSAPPDLRVSAGLTGRLLTAGRNFAPGAPTRMTSSVGYFAETRHSLRGSFHSYWRANGGLASFGYPISEEFVEGAHTVQYFERARFELTGDGGIWLGYIGKELLAKRTPAPVPPSARPEFELHFTGGATNFPGNWDRIISLNESWGNLPWGYHGYGLYAAMPADLNLLGRWGRVTRGDKSIWVQFIDVIDWKDIRQVRSEGKVIDLGQESFAQLGSLREGVMRVNVDVAWPGFHPDFAR